MAVAVDAAEAARRAAVESFVRETCAGRPPSHGYEHMATVAAAALELNTENTAQGQGADPELVHLCAYLHDVADHKYDDKEGSLAAAVTAFLAAHYPPEVAAMVSRVTSAVSFSTEKRRGMRYYEADLPAAWLAVRNVVSDADKLEALGQVGLERCRHYQLELQADLTPTELYRNVVQHCHDKLFRLADEYMRTPAGQRAAQMRRAELVNAVLDWSLELLAEK